MRNEGPAFAASPLTVWVGPMRYVFAPGRDVVVGYGPGCDIPLERLRSAAPPPAPRADVVLRFTGTQWVAIDRSPDGIFVNGARVPTVEIHNGQAISVGDPQRGPRLVFQLGAATGPHGQPPVPPQRPVYPPQHPVYPPPRPPQPPHAPPRPHPQPPRFPPPPPARPPQFRQPPPAPQAGGSNPPDLRVPTERATEQIRIAPPPPTDRPIPPTPSGPAPPPPSTPPPDQPSGAPAVADAEQPQARGLIERMGTRKLRVPRPSFRTEEGNSTYRLPLRPGARTTGVAAYELGLTVDGHEMLADISFTARPGTLTAVIGPSTPRNSALLALLAGTREPTSGRITVDGHDVHAEPESMRTRIGRVTREECLHARLTVERVLGYAAELRLPPDTSAEHRDRVVNQVLEELDLAEHRTTRICKLPPEVRRCASMAIELITRPTLLVVDEPGAGLDASQEAHVMAILRRQADIGCVVVVAMSAEASLSNLNLCDQVIVLTAAGTMGFLGTPQQVGSSMGTTDFAEIFARVSADPVGSHRAYRSGQQAPGDRRALTAPPKVAAPWTPAAELPVQRQVLMLTRRQIRLFFVDRVYFLFWSVLPLVLAALAVLIPGDSGLDRPSPGSGNPHEAIEILAALNIAAVILGTALTIRAVVAEGHVFRREQAVGLSASAYLAAKVIVFSAAAAILTAIVFVVVVVVKGGPAHGAVLLHDATLELYVSVAVTAIVSAMVGLALSTLGNSLREVLPLLVPVVLASLLFDGSLVQLVGKWGFQQISWFVPAQWGFAASASTVDLRRVDALAANAEMWTHYSGWWVFDMIVLLVFGGVAAGFVRYRLRPPRREIRDQSLHREQQELSDLTG
ncbi:ATP-binding cassette domain-containing protein [Mycobacterium sp.]|uniref:ATP-binding cassette domain-containing protein n=1 Tax=Mycobacterium sp. TaxID=1785 RepID=UPI003F98365C